MFVALDLPDEVRQALGEWGRRELTDPALRVIRPEYLHVTLAFLGYRPERDVERIARILHSTELPAPEIALVRDPVAVKKGRSPRLFAVDARSEGTIALQSDVERRLVAERLYKPEKRPFWPHLTVARVRTEKGSRRGLMEVTRPPGPLPEELLAPFRGVRLTLYRSTLLRAGAEYDPLAQVDLPESRAAMR